MTTQPMNQDDPEQSQDDLNMANLVMLWRIYDLLGIIAISVNPQRAMAVLEAHEQGRVIGSPPNLTEEPN